MKKKAINYIIRIIIQRLLGFLFFLLGSWWVMTWKNWVYFGTGFVVTLISLMIIYRINPETLVERGKVTTDSPKWDKVLLLFYWILDFFIIYLIAGFEMKNSANHELLFWIGMILYLISTAITLAALLVNTYLESTVRIQSDRHQSVISKGIYGVVRHPTYSAILLSCISVSLVFFTLFVWITAFAIAVIIIIRTYLEDKYLKTGLFGYLEYTHKTKYRLIPFIW